MKIFDDLDLDTSSYLMGDRTMVNASMISVDGLCREQKKTITNNTRTRKKNNGIRHII